MRTNAKSNEWGHKIKNFWTISEKVKKGDEIKQKLDIFFLKGNEGDDKNISIAGYIQCYQIKKQFILGDKKHLYRCFWSPGMN